jgi:hypothetical protein
MTQKYLKIKKSKSFNISNFFTIGLVLVALSARLTRLLKFKTSMVLVHSWSIIFLTPILFKVI